MKARLIFYRRIFFNCFLKIIYIGSSTQKIRKLYV